MVQNESCKAEDSSELAAINRCTAAPSYWLNTERAGHCSLPSWTTGLNERRHAMGLKAACAWTRVMRSRITMRLQERQA